MRFSLSLALLLAPLLAHGARISFTQVRKQTNPLQRRDSSAVPRPTVFAAADDEDGVDLTSFHDLLYIANVTIAGVEYPLQLDTGSSDLWVKGPSSPLPHTTQTDITLSVKYGIGSTTGRIAYGPAEFAGVRVKNQAFIDTQSSDNPILDYGVAGIVGLGFTKLSNIDAMLSSDGQTNGKSLLYNMFEENPKEPNFIAFALQRALEPGSDVEGSFSIGELEPEYAKVSESPKIPTFPAHDPTRWNMVLDALLVGGEKPSTIPLTSVVANVPAGKTIVMLDSGTSYTYAPPDICKAIYGSIPGAKLSTELQQWILPCDAEVNIALQFGDQILPLHPLDVNPYDPNDNTTCVGSFLPQELSVGKTSFDWLIGDNVMRSMYTVYDFGDFDSSGKMGDPFIQLLSLIDPNEAAADFHKLRGGSSKGKIVYNAADPGDADKSGTPVLASAQLTSTLDKIQAYFPAMLAVMALNALVLLILAGAGVYYLCRRRGKARARKNPGRSTPMPLRQSSFGVPSMAGDAHTYEPVSMALTEDTFVPPAPAFRKGSSGEGSPLGKGSRLSQGSRLSEGRFSGGDGAEPYHPVSMAISEESFVPPPTPPQPPFARADLLGAPSNMRAGDRPKSVA